MLEYELIKEKNKTILLVKDVLIGDITYPFIDDTTVNLDHVYVDSSFRGHNLGDVLVRDTLDFVRESNLKFVATCPYVKKWLTRNHEYDDILSEQYYDMPEACVI